MVINKFTIDVDASSINNKYQNQKFVVIIFKTYQKMTSSDAQSFFERNGLYVAAGVGLTLAAFAARSMFTGDTNGAKEIKPAQKLFKGS